MFKTNPGKTKAELARLMGLEPPAVSKILKGTRQVKAHEYATMRRYFGLPVDGERSLRRPDNAYIIEPLSEDQALQENAAADNDEEWKIPASIVTQRTNTAPENLRTFKINDTLMEPDFRKDEHILVDISDTDPTPPGVFIISDGFGQLARQCEYIPASNPPKIKISAKNNGFEAQILKKDEFEIIGRALAKLQWL